MTQRIVQLLDPSRTLVDEVVGYLRRCTKEGVPANFFDHLMVVVPTAESGRSLRLALTEAFLRETAEGRVGAVLPPRVVQPMQLIRPAKVRDANGNEVEPYPAATEVELQAAFLTFINDPQNNVGQWETLFKKVFLERKETHAFLGFLDQLNEIWHALSSNGLLMQDVLTQPQARAVLERAQGSELQRWEELAQFERAFFAFLEARGLYHHARYIQLALANPAPLPEGIEAVILPALVDPVRVLYPILESYDKPIHVLIQASEADKNRFDEWGRPKVESWTGEQRPVLSLRDEDIVRTATNRALGTTVANTFASATEPSAFPVLGLLDEGVYADVQAAFLTAGVEVHNPEMHTLRVSSLGALLDLLVHIWERRGGAAEWKVMSALLRLHDVQLALQGERQAILKALDRYANTRFPLDEPTGPALERLKKECDRRGQTPYAVLAEALEKLRAEILNPALMKGSLVAFLYEALVRIYPKVASPNKEFLAAIHAVHQLFESLSTEALSAFSQLPEAAWVEIVRRAIASATYSLETPEGAIKTLGWLELTWSSAAQVALIGCHEGCVPDALIGHAFLPDSLRVALGLTSNLQRLARDTYLFKNLLDARQTGDVRVFISLANANGDIQRPSRLLFLCDSNDLPQRAHTLFGDLASDEGGGSRKLPETLRYQWPSEAPLQGASERSPGHLSPSSIDTYIQCPFTYFLRYGLGMSVFTPKDELGADDFGSLTHKILELYAHEQIARTKAGHSQLSDAGAIRASLEKHFTTYTHHLYGTNVSLGLQLQLEALKSRLLAVASVQAQWAQEGWEIAYTEYRINGVSIEGVTLHGSVDRIDVRSVDGRKEFRVIDYKTWDKTDKVKDHLLGSKQEAIEFAKLRGFPIVKNAKDKERRLLTTQLPLYAWALQEKEPTLFRGCIVSLGYLVLGKTEENVQFVEEEVMEHQAAALETVRLAIDQLKHNIFWPPDPSERWRWDFEAFFFLDPEKDASAPWVAEQRQRLSAWMAQHATEVGDAN